MRKMKLVLLLLGVFVGAILVDQTLFDKKTMGLAKTAFHTNIKPLFTVLEQKDPDWKRIMSTKIPCFKNVVKKYGMKFITGEKCWTRISADNRAKKLVMQPGITNCLFQPLSSVDFARKNGKKTVVLAIGIHTGPSRSGSFNTPCANVEYINWERSSKSYENYIHARLVLAFHPNTLKETQKAFWDIYHTNKDLARADIIVCGFNSWHCLIFAPFNKKLIMNPAYRFDGHLPTDEYASKTLQKVLYDAIRYNPDFILAGSNDYDVMYGQHFLGTHKIIPLPAASEHAVKRMKDELANNACPGVKNDTVGYHPMNGKISITPRRLSPGGRIIAKFVRKYLEENKPGPYGVDIMESDLRQPYKFCELGQYVAHVVFGYSVMSYYNNECYALGIPLFAPTPRYYAELEVKHHVIKERKNTLDHTKYDWMKVGKRSLNKGYNPNDDFDMTSLERWLSYSAILNFKGTESFDNLAELKSKIEKADFSQMNKMQIKYAVALSVRTIENWKSIDRYFHGNGQDGGDVIPTLNSNHPATLDEGYAVWAKKIARPNFEEANAIKRVEQTLVLIDLKEYLSEFKVLPKCKKFTQSSESKLTIAFYNEDGNSLVDRNSCHIVSVDEVNPKLPDIFIFRNPVWRKWHHALVAAIHGTQNGATRIIHLKKTKSLSASCRVESRFEGLVKTSSWSQSTFNTQNLWLMWTPAAWHQQEVTSAYTNVLLKNADVKHTSSVCLIASTVPTGPESPREFDQIELEKLEDYLDNWTTDEEKNFFHVVDQLNFELAVRGYFTKSNAILHRLWLQHLTSLNINSQPTIKQSS